MTTNPYPKINSVFDQKEEDLGPYDEKREKRERRGNAVLPVIIFIIMLLCFTGAVKMRISEEKFRTEGTSITVPSSQGIYLNFNAPDKSDQSVLNFESQTSNGKTTIYFMNDDYSNGLIPLKPWVWVLAFTLFGGIAAACVVWFIKIIFPKKHVSKL